MKQETKSRNGSAVQTSTRNHKVATKTNGKAKSPSLSVSEFLKAAEDGTDLVEFLRARGVPMPVQGDKMLPEIRDALQKQQADKPIAGTIRVGAHAYGFLCAGAAVNGFDSWEKMASYLLNEMTSEWSNDYFRIPGAEYGK